MENKKFGAIIQARMGSKRLPGKSNLIIEGKTILNWIINIAKSINGIDHIILATSSERNSDCLEEIAKKEGVFCVRGSENNVLSRYIKAIKKFNLDYVIRITGDDICQDPEFIENTLREFKSKNYEYLISSIESKPLIDGLIFEIFNSKLLLDVSNRKDLSEDDKEHVTTYIRNKKINCKQGYLNKDDIPNAYENKFKFKLCIDTKKDYEMIREAWCSRLIHQNIEIPDTHKIINNIIKNNDLAEYI